MRLIDADELLNAISVHLERIEQEIDDAPTIDPPALIEKPVYLDTEEVTRMVIEKLARHYIKDDADCIIDNAPTIDPVRHGRWVPTEEMEEIYDETYRCTECGFEMPGEWKYCPNCGARMDGGSHEDD